MGGYSAGMLNHKIFFARRVKAEAGKHGLDSGGIKYAIVTPDGVSAGVTFKKGARAFNNGAVEDYDLLMFRVRCRKDIDRWCLIKYHNTWYQIESFNEEFTDNKIQITAREMTNQDVTIVTPPEPSSSEI